MDCVENNVTTVEDLRSVEALAYEASGVHLQSDRVGELCDIPRLRVRRDAGFQVGCSVDSLAWAARKPYHNEAG